MKSIISSVVLVAGSLLSVTVPTSAALAASISERECEALNGTYVKDSPDCQCILPETKPGHNPPGDQGSESQITNTGHGNLNNKEGSSCDGNNGQCK